MTLADLGDRLGAAGTEVSVSIGGMTCGACAARIESSSTRSTASRHGSTWRRNEPACGCRLGFPLHSSSSESSQRVSRRRLSMTSPHPPTSLPRPTAGCATSEGDSSWRVCCSCRSSDASIAFWLVPSLRFPGWQWILLVLAAPILTWAAWPFYKAAIRSARHGIATMDTLVSMGIVAATAWSIYAMFFRDTSHVCSIVPLRAGPPIRSGRSTSMWQRA